MNEKNKAMRTGAISVLMMLLTDGAIKKKYNVPAVSYIGEVFKDGNLFDVEKEFTDYANIGSHAMLEHVLESGWVRKKKLNDVACLYHHWESLLPEDVDYSGLSITLPAVSEDDDDDTAGI